MSKRTGYKAPKSINLGSEEAKQAHKEIEATGDWDEGTLLTFISPPGVPRSERWWKAKLKELLKLYYDERGEIVRYHITLNRGESGREDRSAHMICEPPLPDYEFLDFLWEARLKNGRDGCWITSPPGVKKYQANNQVQPGALWFHWTYHPL